MAMNLKGVIYNPTRRILKIEVFGLAIEINITFPKWVFELADKCKTKKGNK